MSQGKAFNVSAAAAQLEKDAWDNHDNVAVINLLQQIPMQDWNKIVTTVNKTESNLNASLEIVDGANGRPIQESLVVDTNGAGVDQQQVGEVTRPVPPAAKK